LGNGTTLLHNSPLAIYIIIENNSLSLSNTLSVTPPIALSYNIQNNQLIYNNILSVTPITLSYGFQTYSFVHSKTISLTELIMNINIQNDMLVKVAGNIILPITPVSLTYNFGVMSFAQYDPLIYNFDDPIRNYIIFQNDMILTTKPPTYLSQDNPSPWQFANYTFGSMSFAYGTPINLIHNSPVSMTYGFNSFGMHVSANYEISPLNLSYTFSNNMNMKVNQIIGITPITLTYNFQNYVLENDTNVDQLTPLNINYNFGTMNIINNKTFIITPITLKIDFNESNMFFDYHRNNVNYEALYVKFNSINYFVSIKSK
jgi:BarA-like signal transduction histidine kinase